MGWEAAAIIIVGFISAASVLVASIWKKKSPGCPPPDNPGHIDKDMIPGLAGACEGHDDRLQVVEKAYIEQGTTLKHMNESFSKSFDEVKSSVKGLRSFVEERLSE
jgi:hypothetical protein